MGLDKKEEAQQQLAEFERLQQRLLDERRQKYENDLRERNERLRGEETGK
jgi:hypothetical protein